MVRRGRPVPAPVPGARSRPPRDRRRALIGAACWAARAGPGGPDHDRGPRQVEPSLLRPVPAQPHVDEVRTACVAQKHACLLEEEVAEEEVAEEEVVGAAAAASTPLLKYK